MRCFIRGPQYPPNAPGSQKIFLTMRDYARLCARATFRMGDQLEFKSPGPPGPRKMQENLSKCEFDAVNLWEGWRTQQKLAPRMEIYTEMCCAGLPRVFRIQQFS